MEIKTNDDNINTITIQLQYNYYIKLKRKFSLFSHLMIFEM